MSMTPNRGSFKFKIHSVLHQTELEPGQGLTFYQ